MRILGIGELLWDVFDGREQLGGAPFNFITHSRYLGHEILFLSAVGGDERGRSAVARAAELGVSPSCIQFVPDKATGTVRVRLDGSGIPHFDILRPAAYDFIRMGKLEQERISLFVPQCIYFGTLHQIAPEMRHLTREILKEHLAARRFYDVNLRPGCYTPELVRELLREADIVKLNEDEAEAIDGFSGMRHGSIEEFCRCWAEEHDWDAVCVTRGANGCAVLTGDEYAEVPGCAVKVVDTVGAGDAFAAAFLHGFGLGWSPLRIGDFANRLGALVSSREGGVPHWTLEELESLDGGLDT